MKCLRLAVRHDHIESKLPFRLRQTFPGLPYVKRLLLGRHSRRQSGNQRGYLKRISGETVNDVNAPLRLQQLGVGVETTKSSEPADYTELVQVAAIDAAGKSYEVAGTLIGTAQRPRLVHLLGHLVEVTPQGILLILRNRDVPGIVGFLGTVLGKHQVNIANMSLSRQEPGQTALMVINLDSEPSDSARRELKGHKAIRLAKFVLL